MDAWLGQRVEDLPLESDASQSSPTVEFESGGELLDVDPEAVFLPIHVRGQLHVPLGGSARPLAIAVNGCVWALTETYPGRKRLRFTALLPPSALERGANRIEIYEITKVGAKPKLKALAVHGSEDD